MFTHACSCVCVATISLVVTIWSVAFSSFRLIVSVSPVHKEKKPADHMGQLIGLQAVAVRRGAGGCEKKARKVKIKLLWTNSFFDQAAQWWKAFSLKLFHLASVSFTLLGALCAPAVFVMESARPPFYDSTQTHTHAYKTTSGSRVKREIISAIHQVIEQKMVPHRLA